MIVSPQDHILAAVNHETLDHVPTDYWGTPEVTEMLLRQPLSMALRQLGPGSAKGRVRESHLLSRGGG
jgi:hypothetical protein